MTFLFDRGTPRLLLGVAMILATQFHPFFSGTLFEVSHRFEKTSLERLLEIEKEAPTLMARHRPFFVRALMTHTPLEVACDGAHPLGTRIREMLTSAYDATMLRIAFELYGKNVYSIFAAEYECRIHRRPHVQGNDELLGLARVLGRTVCAFDPDRFFEWCANPSSRGEHRTMRLLAAVGASRYDRNKAARALIGLRRSHHFSEREVLQNAFECFAVAATELTSRECFAIANDEAMLPEIRAAAFANLLEGDQRRDIGHPLPDREERVAAAMLLLPRIIAHPGSASALHAIAIRAPKIVAETLAPFVGEMLENANLDELRTGAANGGTSSGRIARVIRAAAIWEFHNYRRRTNTEVVFKDRHTFAENFMILMRLSRDGGLAQECTIAEKFLSDPGELLALMYLYRENHVFGRPDWADFAKAIRRFAGAVTDALSETTELLLRDDMADRSIRAQPLRFLDAVWRTGRPKKKHLYRIRATRDMFAAYGFFEEANAIDEFIGRIEKELK